MRIPCPFCGARDADEFVCIGTVGPDRPAADAPLAAFVDYLHIRDNPAGETRERWQHVHGCRQWLVLTRDTRSHALVAAELSQRRFA